MLHHSLVHHKFMALHQVYLITIGISFHVIFVFLLSTSINAINSFCCETVTEFLLI